MVIKMVQILITETDKSRHYILSCLTELFLKKCVVITEANIVLFL